MNNKMALYALCACLFSVLFVGMASVDCAEEKLPVFVSILPQSYFVKRIGGDKVDVKVLVQPGHSPATYEPTPRQMADLSGAKIFFSIGVPFEAGFVPKIKGQLKNLKIVDTSKGVKIRKMKAHSHHEGDHKEKSEEHKDDKDDHKHVGNDPHIWLNPLLVKIQGRNIADALVAIDPTGKDVYEKNYASFAADLDKLDTELKKTLAPVKGKSFMVFHPSWGYFADEYGLEQEPVEIEGKEPSAKQLAYIIEEAKKENIKVIFVQPQFSKTSAKSIAREIGGSVTAVNPLAYEYMDNLRKVAGVIVKSLSSQK